MNFAIPVRENLELKLRTETDAEAFFKLVDENRDYLRQWLPWLDATKTVDDTLKYIQSTISKFESKESIDLGIWHEGQWVGSIGFNYWDKANRKDTVGYWLAEKFQGRGIMTDAVRALITYGFTEMNLNRIKILCAVENTKSRAVPERLGLVSEDVTRQCEWLYDHFIDSVTYSILSSEWKR